MRLLVLSDTHLSAATLDRMPTEVWDLADEADAVLHAGDVVDVAVLDASRERAPVHAVLGNNDHGLGRVLPEVWEDDLGGVRVGMVHDSGATAGRAHRMRRRFPDARSSCSATATIRSSRSAGGSVLVVPRLSDAATAPAGPHGRLAQARRR